MPQIGKEENVKNYVHNNKNTNPSLFSEIEDPVLRNKNRGSVMANIFERHTTKDRLGASQLLPKDFSSMSRELEAYVLSIPKRERGKAKECMMEHLGKRGYSE